MRKEGKRTTFPPQRQGKNPGWGMRKRKHGRPLQPMKKGRSRFFHDLEREVVSPATDRVSEQQQGGKGSRARRRRNPRGKKRDFLARKSSAIGLKRGPRPRAQGEGKKASSIAPKKGRILRSLEGGGLGGKRRYPSLTCEEGKGEGLLAASIGSVKGFLPPVKT